MANRPRRIGFHQPSAVGVAAKAPARAGQRSALGLQVIGGAESEHSGGQNPRVRGENPTFPGTEPERWGDRVRTIHRGMATKLLSVKDFFRMGKLPNLSLIYF
ncbi:protein of unknown function [Cupriavidus neocaledonicus]|uniref:Uncharacterized protein n=1 Tax=Cupriavidus neocaledonicus TaxID=1040979 RepID=A0A375HBY8_9BURK|nr:protein of unknown function [Cupriavidus neocaledonicus]